MKYIKEEFKLLLLKDLYARLPYGTIIQVKEWATVDTELKFGHIERLQYGEIELKPYLRPMSSMTEEEKEELSHLLPKDWSVEIDKLNNFYFDMCPSIFMEIDVFLNIIDWLNAHHFDYRGLIEKGLAIKAPEGMYNNEQNK